MILLSDLNNWINGNYSDLDRSALIAVAKYYEYVADNGYLAADDLIIDDTEKRL